ncbi:MAG TPA: histidine phosphatase family protein [Clostridiaceae bacterium]|nr:histidine phosphatase family protein [Clostridiaceae bacterium]
MKRLYLLRHAKSSWDNPELKDFDRPLNKRGYKEAKEMAEYIKEKDYYPDVILCSTARRTRGTLEPILLALNYDKDPVFLDSIYESSWLRLKEEVEKRDEESVMLIGHCPGIELYLSALLREYKSMKTSHLAVVDMEQVKLIDFIRPKEFSDRVE